MQPEDTSIALNRFLLWVTQMGSAEQAGAAETAKSSSSIRFCLCLIYYFTLCDFILKFLPLKIAIVLRYLPEAALYIFALLVLIRRRGRASFPLGWPLFACALTMGISVLLNSSSIIAGAEDYRLYFRFAAFSYIGWKTAVTPARVRQFINGFLGLTIIELVIAGMELVGGAETQHLFAPVLGLITGAAGQAGNEVYGQVGWIFGTLADYNHFGFFMTISFIVSLALYFVQRARRYLWLAAACALAVMFSFSRHSLLMLIVGFSCFLLLRRRKAGLGKLIWASCGTIILTVSLLGLGMRLDSGFKQRVETTVSAEVLATDSVQNVRFYLAAVLTPRFLSDSPFFGQGPIDPADAVQFGDADTAHGPTLKGAPDVPGILTYYLADVVWVMILGLYGCAGLAAFGYVLWTIGASASKILKENRSPEGTALAQACLATIAIFVISGFFSEEMIARDSIPVFWLLAGMVLSFASETPSDGICLTARGASA